MVSMLRQISVSIPRSISRLYYKQLAFVRSVSTQELLKKEDTFAAHNYHPIPVMFEKAEGVYAWDPEGNKYMDFLSGYSALNQGHCHPAVMKTFSDQAHKLSLSSRAFHNSVFPVFAEYITKLFGYEKVLPMNTGAEAVETSIKMCRKWGYSKKKIPANKAIIISACQCFHGRTFGAISMSCDPDAQAGFQPLLDGMHKVDFGDIKQLEAKLTEHGPNVAAFIVEPIQGEAGVVVPPDGYLKAAFELCQKHNVLFVADEIQTGLGRTGKMLATEWEGFRPDVLLLGKALGGGVMPVSVVLADNHVMDVFQPNTHGSTFGGNPIACAVAMTALRVIKEEGMVENAQRLGEKLRKELSSIQSPILLKVRGRGLLNAIVIDDSKTGGKSAYDLCILMKQRGLLAKSTHGNIIRFAPPLIMTDAQLDSAISIIKSSLKDFETLTLKDIPGAVGNKHKTTPCLRCGRVEGDDGKMRLP